MTQLYIHYGNKGKLGQAQQFNMDNDSNGLWLEGSDTQDLCETFLPAEGGTIQMLKKRPKTSSTPAVSEDGALSYCDRMKGLLAASAGALLLVATGAWAQAPTEPETSTAGQSSSAEPPSAQPAAHAIEEVTNFGPNPGKLKMYKYIPANLQPNRPMVVALHGCSQKATDYDNETGWTKYADLWGFALLLPEQQPPHGGTGNLGLCFNWFRPQDSERDAAGNLQGEAASILQMVEKMVKDHQIDQSRIYVTGLSGGGAMTAVMLALAPDTFSGGGVVAGVPYHCASGPHAMVNQPNSQAWICMGGTVNLSPAQWGEYVRRASPGFHGPWPIVSIWQGTADQTVKQPNATELMEQWTNVHGADQTADLANTVKGYPHRVYNDTQGRAVVETYTIDGMDHGTPVDPPAPGQDQIDKCGVAARYILDANICSSYFIARFWGLGPETGSRTAQ